MDLEERLLLHRSRAEVDRIASWIGDDARRFRSLMKIFLQGDALLAQRAAWVVSICAERHPGLVRPWIRRMIDRMLESGIHDAVRRSVVHALQTADIPPRLLGRVATVCFDQLADVNAPVAVKVFAMTVISRIARGRPDLGKELRLVIDRHLPYESAAFAARARMILKTPGKGPGARR